jgi:predicted HD phosphohydrolase
VFDLGRDQLPYDEEFQLAALLHDVGKAIDAENHTAAALEALDGLITPRTVWLIEHHMAAQKILDGTLGARARRRLQADDSYEELLLLARCDRRGRRSGVEVPDVEEALDSIRELSATFG